MSTEANITPDQVRLIARSYGMNGQREITDKLNRLATRLEWLDSIDDGTIGRLITQLRAHSGDHTFGMHLTPAQCSRLADALLKEGAETAERLASAGYSAAMSEREAKECQLNVERATRLAESSAKELANEIVARNVIHREFCEALMELEEERALRREIEHQNERLAKRIARLDEVNLNLYVAYRKAQDEQTNIGVEVVFTVGDADAEFAIDPSSASDLALELMDLNRASA